MFCLIFLSLHKILLSNWTSDRHFFSVYCYLLLLYYVDFFYFFLFGVLCTVNCRPTASNYQLSHLRPSRGSNPGLRGGRRECCHSATVAPVYYIEKNGNNRKTSRPSLWMFQGANASCHRLNLKRKICPRANFSDSIGSSIFYSVFCWNSCWYRNVKF